MRIFFAFILSQRERKRHWVVHEAQPCVLHFHVIDHFILGSRRLWVLKHYNDRVKGEICFKEIVSNTKFDMNYSSFHAFGLWVFNYLQISFYIYSVFVYCFCLSLLFVLLLIVRSMFCSFCFITKVNCCNISNSLLLGFGTIFGGVYKGSFRIDFLGFGSYFLCFFFFLVVFSGYFQWGFGYFSVLIFWLGFYVIAVGFFF